MLLLHSPPSPKQLASGLPYRRADRASRDRLTTTLELVSMHADERGSVITILATPQAA